MTENSPPIAGGQVFSTKQASELTGIPEATIRSWKQRGKVAPQHFTKDEAGNTLWTSAGLAEIQRLSGATVSDAPTATPNDAACNATIDDLLNPLADALAVAWIQQQLPHAVRAAIVRLLTSSDEGDRHRLQQIFESMNLTLTINAFNSALHHAVAASQQSLKESLKALEAAE